GKHVGQVLHGCQRRMRHQVKSGATRRLSLIVLAGTFTAVSCSGGSGSVDAGTSGAGGPAGGNGDASVGPDGAAGTAGQGGGTGRVGGGLGGAAGGGPVARRAAAHSHV